MQIGRLRRRVQIQSETVTGDGMGGQTTTWATVSTVWGDLTALRNSEAYLAAAEQVQGRQMQRLRIRYRDDLTIRQRVIVDGHTYQIHSVEDSSGRQRELNLMISEVV